MSFGGVTQAAQSSTGNLYKYNRNYVLNLTGSAFSTPLTITYPITLEFDIQRTNFSTVNKGKLRLYNLSAEHRGLIVHDQWDTSVYSPQTIFAELFAGYGNGPIYPIVLKGNAVRAYSYRQGVNFITELDIFDGGNAYAAATSDHSFGGNIPLAQVYNTLINDLLPYGISKGVVSSTLASGTLTKGQAYTGNTIELLTRLTNSNFCIDNLNAHILGASDAIGGSNVTISSASGLLGTPIKESQWLLVDILFEPRLVIGSLIQLQTIGALPYFNGPHKVASISHRGIISAAVCGEAVTSLGLEAGIFTEF